MASHPDRSLAETPRVFTKEYAQAQDAADPLAPVRHEFLIPSKANLRSHNLVQGTGASDQDTVQGHDSHDSCIYLCGNSLGLQPKRTSVRIQQYLTTWATQGVFGHFKPLEGSPLPTWLDVDDEAARMIAPIVGADKTEVAVMQTLTANLHLLMASFYRPDPKGRHKIILESKAFPSDHYAVQSQIRHHGLSPSDSMICIDPPSLSNPILTTEYILSIIDQHASTTALLLLPGIQFYTGQLLDIPTITTHARSLGIFVIWDLAHAAGNVPLHLHDWNVDAAAWCSYKYLNSGPGSIAGLFVHERHGVVSDSAAEGEDAKEGFVNRLSGWWGSSKSSRFKMTNEFHPTPGAAGWQLSNPSVFDNTSLCASLEVFSLTSMAALRKKSLSLTAYLEVLLHQMISEGAKFSIITPSDPQQRGAQLSLKLDEGLLDIVMEELEKRGVVVDERRPDVIRVAPAPLYNSWEDVWGFWIAFGEALVVAGKLKAEGKAVGKDELLQTT